MQVSDALQAVRALWETLAGVGSMRLRPPADRAAIDEWERTIGRGLPDDLRALYEIADGASPEVGLFLGEPWMPVRAALEAYRDLQWRPAPREDEVLLDADPPNTVRRLPWSPGWMPFGGAGDDAWLAVDLDPAPAGRVGQVIRIARHPAHRTMRLAESLTDLLGQVIDALVGDSYRVEPRGADRPGRLEVWRTEPERLDPESEVRWDALPEAWRQALDAGSAGEARPTRRRLRSRAELVTRGRPLPTLAPLELMPELQRLSAEIEAGIGFAPVASLRRLLALELWGPAVVDLDPLRGLPLERLALTAIHTESLEALGELPGLRSLSLATCDARPLAVLGRLPALRWLALSGAHGDMLPPMRALEKVSLSYSRMGDLSTLAASTRLLQVEAGRVRRPDGAPAGDDVVRAAAGLPALRTLGLAGAGVTGVHALRDHPCLQDLDLSGNPVRDLSPLVRIPRLRRLVLDPGQWEALSRELPRMCLESPVVAGAGSAEERRSVERQLAEAMASAATKGPRGRGAGRSWWRPRTRGG
jgi:cell wall assembly regulator SMI1